jgi:hypothetical protein
MTEMLGWVATAVFVASYFFARPGLLRAAQMSGAILWIVYGFLIGAIPVIAANALVFAAAAWTLARSHSVPQPNPAASLPAVPND